MERMKILNEAKKQFASKGDKFTLDVIVKKQKISKKTIYRFFESKDELINEIVRDIFKEVFEACRQVEEDESLLGLDKIREMLCIIAETYTEFSVANLSKIEYAKDLTDSFWKMIDNIVLEETQKGEIRKVKTEYLRFILEASIIRIDECKNISDKREFADEIVCIIVDGMR
ncbi:MAG: TetR/AcrR family transcriptional regulator [Lachnospiraceae bacterium]|nr:TetR/AcrR family transcriptional regulator [Lachnospiraceae bacterium]